jgi:small subunit ribosomal protein S11
MAEEEKPEDVEEKDAAPAAESTEETPAAEAAPEEAPAVSEEAAPAAPAEGAPAEEGAEDKKEKEKPRTAEDIFLELEGAEGAETPKVLKAKGSKNISVGIVHVSASFNNTIVTVADPKGDVIGWSSAGKMGFRGSRKSTAYASQLVAQDACRQAMSHGLKQAEVRVKGPGAGRESAVRAVQGLGIEVTSIKDVTPVPHNGCRPKKARRV